MYNIYSTVGNRFDGWKFSLASKYNTFLGFRHEEVIIYNLEEVHQRSLYLGCSYIYFFRAQFLSTQNEETEVSSAMIDT